MYEEETGRNVEVRFGETSQLAATILEEGENTPADVFFAQDAGALGALQDEGRLAELPPDILERVDPEYRSEQGDWVGVSARARVVAYDERELEEGDLPDSILGFADDEWSGGRIGWAPTNASLQAFVTALRLVEGEEAARAWLEGIVAGDVQVYDNNVAVRDAVAAGEIDVGFINHYYVAQAVAEEGDDYPVGTYYPPGGDAGSLVNVAGVGMLEGTDDPELALDFIEYMLGPEAQQYFADSSKEYPLAGGVEPDPSLVPLSEIEQPDVDLSNLDDLEGTLELMQETGAL
jgi:iron(III) transport system substrate-binding protein